MNDKEYLNSSNEYYRQQYLERLRKEKEAQKFQSQVNKE